MTRLVNSMLRGLDESCYYVKVRKEIELKIKILRDHVF